MHLQSSVFLSPNSKEKPEDKKFQAAGLMDSTVFWNEGFPGVFKS